MDLVPTDCVNSNCPNVVYISKYLSFQRVECEECKQRRRKNEPKLTLVDYREVKDKDGDVVGGCALINNETEDKLIWRIRGIGLSPKAERLEYHTFDDIEDCKKFAQKLLT